ncbi:toprim domain-containing protein [Candidatus Woesearchaeota archaeon]|nr:toprim domain-containing protein [Candidatus Woesearchaeota archaeon]
MNEHTAEFQRIIYGIKNSNTLVIVEGKKDRAALHRLGIKNIVELSKKPLFQIVEEIAGSNKECIILTDLDKKGREIYGKLNSNLQKHGVKVNNKLREFLFKNTKLRQIEGISSYFNSKSLDF